MTRIGDVLNGRYKLLAPAANQGSMAQLFIAWDEADKQRCAVKVLPATLAHQEQLRDRFLQEQSILERLGGDGATILLGSGITDPGERYFVMELLRGWSLRHLLQQHGCLPPAAVALVLHRAARTLDRVHGRGILHRDLKPEHIYFGKTGAALFIDFGISKDLLLGGVKTMIESRVGSPWYMAPERARAGGEDQLSDIYALGVIAFEALTGQVPFEGDNMQAILDRVLKDPPPSVCALRPGLPPVLDQVFDIALAKAPDRRFQSAGALATAFASVLGLSMGALDAMPFPAPPPDKAVVGTGGDGTLATTSWRPLALELAVTATVGVFLGILLRFAG